MGRIPEYLGRWFFHEHSLFVVRHILRAGVESSETVDEDKVAREC